MLRRLAVSCAVLFALTVPTLSAAEPSAARVRFVVLHKGEDFAGTGRIPDLATTDTLIVILIGSGQAQLTVGDTGFAGDTVTVSGFLQTAFPMSISGSATSPTNFVQNLLITRFGILQLNVGYSAAVNPFPLDYFYTISF